MLMSDNLKGKNKRYSLDSQNSNKKIFVAAAILLSLAIIIVSVYRKSQAEKIATHPETLCPMDQPPSKVNVLLLDMKNEYSNPQRLKILNEINRLWKDIEKLGLIEIYTVDRLEQRVTTLNAIYQNPQMAKRKWARFTNELDEELQRLMATEGNQTSTIFEAVQATALRTFNKPEHEGLPKRLVIASDLLQNMPGKLSQYQDIGAFQDFNKTTYYMDIRADLSGVNVTILYLVRPRTPQKWLGHIRFLGTVLFRTRSNRGSGRTCLW